MPLLEELPKLLIRSCKRSSFSSSSCTWASILGRWPIWRRLKIFSRRCHSATRHLQYPHRHGRDSDSCPRLCALRRALPCARRSAQKFLKLWPFLLVFDVLWSLSPFLLLHHINFGLALACTTLLVYSPFAQRSLVLMGAGSANRKNPHPPADRPRSRPVSYCLFLHFSKIDVRTHRRHINGTAVAVVAGMVNVCAAHQRSKIRAKDGRCNTTRRYPLARSSGCRRRAGSPARRSEDNSDGRA